MKILPGILIITAFIFSQNVSAQVPAKICACGENCSCKKQTDSTITSKAICKCGGNCTCGKQMQMEDHMMQMDMHQQTNKHPYLLIMDTMMIAMDEAKLTNVLEANFLSQMIPHHQGAVEMARYQIANGQDPQMIQLAKSILAEQKYEIQEMQSIFQTITSGTTVKMDYYKPAMDKTMTTMMNNMPSSNASFQDNDIAFAEVMMPHHQAAVDMSLALLKMNPNKMLTNVAEKIITSQQVEIEQMKLYIQQRSRK